MKNFYISFSTFITIALFCLNNKLYCQNSITIEGKIIDAHTEEPLPFASVHLKSAPMGVISGENGYFSFHFPEIYGADTLCISSIGYEQQRISLNNYKSNETIKLLPKTYSLEEVTVMAISARDILKKAIKNIKKNYPHQPYTLAGDFHEYIRESDKYVRALEASVHLTDENAFKLKGEYFIIDSISLSVSRIKEEHQQLLFKNQILSIYLEFGILLNYSTIDSDGKYTIEDIKQNGTEKIYVIKCVGETYEQTYHINASDYAITYSKFVRTKPAINDSETNDIWRDYLEDSSVIALRKYGEYYYPFYLYNYLTLRQHKGKDNPNALYTYTSYSQMLVTNIENSAIRKKRKNLKRGYEDIYFSKVPVKKVWKNYNTLPNSKIRKEALKQLEIQ